MTLDVMLEEDAPDMSGLVDAFADYLAGLVSSDADPDAFFRSASIAIQEAAYGRNGARFEDVPPARVVSLSAYLPELARRTLEPEAAEAVERAYPDVFSER